MNKCYIENSQEINVRQEVKKTTKQNKLQKKKNRRKSNQSNNLQFKKKSKGKFFRDMIKNMGIKLTLFQN